MTYPGQPQAPALNIVDPIKAGGGPATRNLMGRTCAIICDSYNPNNKFPGDDKPNPQAICTIYVLDGGPLTYGEGERPPTPATHRCEIPAVFTGAFLNGPVATAVGGYAGTGSVVFGRFVQGKTARLFVALGSELDGRAAEAGQLHAALTQLIVAHRSGQWTAPKPVELNAAPQAAPGAYGIPQAPAMAPSVPQVPQVNYGQAPAVPQVPSVPQVPQAPARPWPWGANTNPGNGWTPQVWADNADKMSESDYQHWRSTASA